MKPLSLILIAVAALVVGVLVGRQWERHTADRYQLLPLSDQFAPTVALRLDRRTGERRGVLFTGKLLPNNYPAD